MADTDKSSTSELPARDPHYVDPHHGNSVAAWTAVGIMLVGSTICAFAVGMTSLVLGIVGAVVILVGAGAGKVLSGMGLGAGQHGPHGTR